MIRTSRHKLFSTNAKNNTLDILFVEYSKCLNEYIKILWKQNTNKTFINKETYKSVNSWMSSRLLQSCAKQALSIVKTAKKANNNIIYNKWKKVYRYCKKNNRNWKIVNETYTNYRKNHTLRDRINPIFQKQVIEFNANCCIFELSKNAKEFDFWIKLTSIGNKIKLLLPTKDHKHCQLLVKQNFKRKNSFRLSKIDDTFYIDIFWEKETPETKLQGETLGIDLGINKLISLSNGEFLGTELKSKIECLNKKKQRSKSYNRKLKEIKNYIGQEVNKINFSNVKTFVLEDLKNIKNHERIMNKEDFYKGKSKRKMLSKWNRRLVTSKLHNKCEMNRVQVAIVSPAWTSQKCSLCGAIHKESRVNELYKCLDCGSALDADYNASVNIKNSFLCQSNIVADDVKINCHRNDLL
jgi:IS605 OrfB family transposase